ncbi:MAG: PTS sugar transporter subunit IIA [Deltaproteobacteria bacterium]|jgi:PTS system nitrogen regulatory IIA component|nr:PTS sugar transporter subunit IIA [Deltaproteobacteria bacterium]
MDIFKYFNQESVWLDIKVGSKTEAIDEMCGFAARALGLEKALLLEVVVERENLGSTSVGGGVAIPHGKTDLVDEVFLFLARTAPGWELTDCDSPDGRPVRLLALLLIPDKPDQDHLRALAALGRLWRTPQNINLMLEAKDAKSFLETLSIIPGLQAPAQ